MPTPKTIIHPVTGKRFKLGRNRPPVRLSKVSMHSLKAAGVLPTVAVPDVTTYAFKAAASLLGVMGNDNAGDCVEAGGAHIRGVTSANAGTEVVFTDAQVISEYSALTGYDPSQTDADGNNPTDQGTDENSAIARWENVGWVDGVKLLHAVSIDATNIANVREALYLFENVFFGVSLPDAWVNPMPSDSGFTWDVVGEPDDRNGHCFVGVDLAKDGITIATWGMTGFLTNEALSYYGSHAQGGQCFALLTADIISRVTGKSPAGYDPGTLQAFLDSL